jgi:hypothetical protein
MPRYLNASEMDQAVSRFIKATKPNRLALALVVRNLAEWADEHSDGWAYWQAPRRAANEAMGHIESTTNAANVRQDTHDITDEQMRAAVKPIRAFLTRQRVSVETKERILRAVDEPTRPEDVRPHYVR